MAIIKRFHKVIDDVGPATGTTQNSTSEVAFPLVKAQFTAQDIAKLAAGGMIEFEGAAKFTATHSTDTAQARVRFGKASDALGSRIAVAADTAFDAADNNSVRVKGTIALQAVGASGEFHSAGQAFHTGGSQVETILHDQSLDLSVPLELAPTVQWSVADAGNVLTWKWFKARIIDADELS